MDWRERCSINPSKRLRTRHCPTERQKGAEMILHDVVQGTPEWLRARIGIPTASNFDEILTPAKGDYSASAAMYENQIVAEIFSGESQEDFGGTTWTERGKEYEPE